MWPNPQFPVQFSPQFPVDLVTFIEEILNRKLYFLCNAFSRMWHPSKEYFSGKTDKNAYFKPFLDGFYLSSENMVQITWSFTEVSS